MARKEKRIPFPNTGAEPIPPGATTKRHEERPRPSRRGSPGSGAGPRHAANDPDSPDESYEPTDTNQPLAEPPQDDPQPLQEGPPYAGISGGAVGGSPAEGRSTGGRTGGGLAPGESHRGDSTIGSITSGKSKRGKNRRGGK